MQAFLHLLARVEREEGDEEPTEEEEWEAAVAMLRDQVASWKGEGVSEL